MTSPDTCRTSPASSAGIVAVAAIVVASAAGCATGPTVARVLTETALKESVLAKYEHRYPNRFESIHRATLTLRGRDFVLDGFVRVTPNEVRMVAATGFGTTLFQLELGADGNDAVNRVDSALAPAAVLAGPARDLRAMYLDRPGAAASVAQLEGGGLALVESTSHHTTRILTVDPASYHCTSIIDMDRSKMIRRVLFSEFAEQNGYSYPSRILIENFRERYRVDVRVASVTPRDEQQ